jgi:hypothetical protein
LGDRASEKVAPPAPDSILLSESPSDGDGTVISRHACLLGREGLVSKRRDAGYRSGRPACATTNTRGGSSQLIAIEYPPKDPN